MVRVLIKKTGSDKPVTSHKTKNTAADDDGDGHLLTPHIHGFNDDEDWNSGSEPFGKLLPLSIK